MRKFVLLILMFVLAVPQMFIHAAIVTEPLPTPVIEAPPAPPLAIALPVDDLAEDYEEVDRSLLLLILIIVVASATALALGFYAYRKVRQFLSTRKDRAAKKAKE